MQFGLLPDGVYDYCVVDAQDRWAKKSGVEMIFLNLKLITKEGNAKFLDEFLHPSMFEKLEHFCQSHGLQENLNQGILVANDCKDKIGKLLLGKKIDEQYGTKNVVIDYVDKSTPSLSNSAKVAEELKNEDLPF